MKNKIMKHKFFIRSIKEWANENTNIIDSFAQKYPEISYEHTIVILYANALNISDSDVWFLLYKQGKLKIRKNLPGNKYIFLVKE